MLGFVPSDSQKLIKVLIRYAKTNGIELTHLKLQKVLYYVQAWGLAYFDDALFAEEPQAWVNGPVYVSVYQQFRDRRDEPIVVGGSFTEEDSRKLSAALRELNLSADKQEMVEAVLDEYMTRSVGELVHLSHRERPWREARGNCQPFEPSNAVISHAAMRRYYRALLEQRSATPA